MKLIFVMLFLFASAAFAGPVDDHKAALKTANTQFTAAFEACSDIPWREMKARNKCRGTAKGQHTKAVEKADAAMKAAK